MAMMTSVKEEIGTVIINRDFGEVVIPKSELPELIFKLMDIQRQNDNQQKLTKKLKTPRRVMA